MIVAGIASIPQREGSLKLVLDSISPQVDLILLVLNGHEVAPPYLSIYDNIEYIFADNRNGDAEKFALVSRMPDCYYLACDDDIIYPEGYVSYMIDKCILHDCPVSCAGKRFKYPVQSYHRSATHFFHCLRDVDADYDCDVIGTGVLCYRTSQLRVDISDFPEPNMADLWFAMLAAKAKVPLKAVSHSSTYLKYIPQKWTIWGNKPKTGEENKLINDILRIKYNLE